MGRINNCIKFTVLNVNFCSVMFAIALIVLSAFILSSKWGTLDPKYFQGWGVTFIMFGVLVVLASVLGCMGVIYQIKRDGTKYFQYLKSIDLVTLRNLDG